MTKLTSKINVAMYLSMMTLAAAAPASASAFAGVGLGGAPPKSQHHNGVSKAKYIKAADKLCAAMNTELAPAFSATRDANLGYALENETTVSAEIEASAHTTLTTFQKLRKVSRPSVGRNELIGYFNAESVYLTETFNYGVALHNDEPAAIGTASAKAELAKISANEAVSSYGFKVCGL
jgi:hypothetical protein